jgi:hypothetical protein
MSLVIRPHSDGKIEHVVYNDQEHWEGRRYPDWELEKMGEGDSHYNRWDMDLDDEFKNHQQTDSEATGTTPKA